MLTDVELLALNQRGLIPGPEEREDQFLKRIQIKQEIGLSDSDWQGARAITESLFDFSADWVHAFYAKKRLPLWQGAVTWIGELPTIQLHPRFKKGKFFIYHRDEVLAHEAVHAARHAFSEPRFEEHFAYLTSKDPLRRWLGPLFRTSTESALFLLFLVGTLPTTLLSPFLPALLTLSVSLIALVRVALSHKTLKRCQRKLETLLKKPALPLLLRLTDREIKTFANASEDEIRAYVQTQKNSSLRWRMLSISFF